MKEKYRNLVAAFKLFSEEFDLSFEQNIESLKLAIKQGYIDKNKFIEELNQALKDPTFNWVDFAIVHKLIIPTEGEVYTNTDVENYLRSLVWNYLFPDFLNPNFMKSLKTDALEILKNQCDNNDLISYEELFEKLRQKKKYKEMDILYLRYIEWGKNVEIKAGRRNHIAPGFLKYLQD